MSFEHAPQTEHQEVSVDQYQKLQNEIAHLDETISEIDRNVASQDFYTGDRKSVDESREFFLLRRAEAIHKISTFTLSTISNAA